MQRDWYYEIKGAAPFWIAALLFILVGGAFTATGMWAEELFFIIAGVPFLCLGALILPLLIYSLYLKFAQPENYKTWLWWVNFVGGLAGALTFAIPSTLMLPVLLLLIEMDNEALLIGVGFSIVGLAVTIGVWFVARKQYRERPRWVHKNRQKEAK